MLLGVQVPPTVGSVSHGFLWSGPSTPGGRRLAWGVWTAAGAPRLMCTEGLPVEYMPRSVSRTLCLGPTGESECSRAGTCPQQGAARMFAVGPLFRDSSVVDFCNSFQMLNLDVLLETAFSRTKVRNSSTAGCLRC